MGHDGRDGLCSDEADVRHRVVEEGAHDWEEHRLDGVGGGDGAEAADGRERSEAADVAAVTGELHDLREERAAHPRRAERAADLFEVFDGFLTDGEDFIAEPRDAETEELLGEERRAELLSDVRDEGD